MMVPQNRKAKKIPKQQKPSAGLKEKRKNILANRFSVFQAKNMVDQTNSSMQGTRLDTAGAAAGRRTDREEESSDIQGMLATSLKVQTNDFNFSVQGLEGLHETPITFEDGRHSDGKGEKKGRGRKSKPTVPSGIPVWNPSCRHLASRTPMGSCLGSWEASPVGVFCLAPVALGLVR